MNLPALQSGNVDAAALAEDRARRGRCTMHYEYEDIIRHATGRDAHPRLFTRHLENCQPCRQDCENAIETARQIREAFGKLEADAKKGLTMILVALTYAV